MRGYSLYLHEFVELKYYEEQQLNLFDARVQIRHYRAAHSLGLLVEHRFLQVVAQEIGENFNLQELILGNPYGDPPQRDWRDVWTHRRHQLSPADATLNPSHNPRVSAFYRRLGFQKVT